MSRNERTNWRDPRLMDWHRIRRLHCKAAGICLLLLEYYGTTPAALIEYRRYQDGVPNTDLPIYQSLNRTCGTLPFFIAYQEPKTLGFNIVPQNLAARENFRRPLLSEAEFAKGLHKIRGITVSGDFPSGLGQVPPAAPLQMPMCGPQQVTLDGAPWNGAEISNRHRDWGRELYSVDLDYLLIDNNDAVAICLVEYKLKYAQPVRTSDYKTGAQCKFAADTGLPFMIVTYCNVDWWFRIEYAQGLPLSYDRGQMPGQEYAAYLQRLRGLRTYASQPREDAYA